MDDYAPLFDTAAFGGGSDFSLDVQVAPLSGRSLGLRWLFTDSADGEELVTSFEVIIADRAFHTILSSDLDLSTLILLGAGGSDPVDEVLTGRMTAFPVSLESFSINATGVVGRVHYHYHSLSISTTSM